MDTALYACITIFCILLLLIILVRILINVDKQSSQLRFCYVLAGCIALFSSDLLWVLIENNNLQHSMMFSYLVNCVYFIMTGITGYCWFIYSETIQNSSLIRNKSIMGLFTIPLLLLTILVINSPLTGWIFYITDGNTYHRGPFYLLQPCLAYGYVIITFITSLCKVFKKENYTEKNKYLILIFFSAFSTLSVILQALIPGLPLTSTGITLPLIFVYCFSLEMQIVTDALTGLNNRRRLLNFLFQKLQHPREYKDLYLLLIDVDYFKKINSQYGRTRGDEALVYVASALKNVVRHTDYFIARYGGDEFIVVCEVSHIEIVHDFCININKEIAHLVNKDMIPYPLSVSIGYAKNSSAITKVSDLIHSADTDLYNNRKAQNY